MPHRRPRGVRTNSVHLALLALIGCAEVVACGSDSDGGSATSAAGNAGKAGGSGGAGGKGGSSTQAGSAGNGGDPASGGGSAASGGTAGSASGRSGGSGGSSAGETSSSAGAPNGSGGDAAGGAAGDTQSSGGGGQSSAGAAGEGGAAGAAAECSDTSTHYFDYYHDGLVIGWVTPGASGTVQDLAGSAPQSFPFAEGSVDGFGLVSDRHNATVVAEGGSLFRLEGADDCDFPPDPQQVGNLSDIGEVCYNRVYSDLKDRSKSLLIFQYASTGNSCSTAGVDINLDLLALPLLASSSDAPTVLDKSVRPLFGDFGNLDDVLAVPGDQTLIRATSLTDTTELGELSGAVFVIDVEATNLGNGRHLLGVLRLDSSYELFVYDSSTHTLSNPLGTFGAYDASSISIERGIARDATYGFFVANAYANPTARKLYRFPLDGSSGAVELNGLTATNLAVLDVIGNKLFYRVISGGPGAGIYWIPANANFASPPAATTLLSGSKVPVAFSSNRLFYRNVNLSGVIALDGTNQQETASLAFWLGCVKDPDADYPANPVISGRCGRAYLFDQDAGEILSYDADAAPSPNFFGVADADEIVHGLLPGETVFNPTLVDAVKLPSAGLVNPYPLTAGHVMLKAPADSFYRDAIFYVPGTGAGSSGGDLTNVSNPGFVNWLSRL